MADKGGFPVKEFKVSDMYQGGFDSLDPNKAYDSPFFGYHAKSAGVLGAPTKPDTANQIQQVTQLLNQGMVPVEIGTLGQEVFDQIPKQQFAEIRRLAKLAGGKISVHAPIQGFDPSGLDPQGGRPWDESYRLAVEKQLTGVIDRAADLVDEKEKNPMPINFHVAGLPGKRIKINPETKKVETDYLVIINKDSGKLYPLPQTEKFNPELGVVAKEFTDKESEDKFLRKLNRDQWMSQLQNVSYNKRIGDDMIIQGDAMTKGLEAARKKGELKFDEIVDKQVQEAELMKNRGAVYLNTVQRGIYDAISEAYKFCNEEEKKKIKEASEKFKQDYKDGNIPLVDKSGALNRLLNVLEEVQPQVFERVEDFAIDKTAKTFANLALHGYQKFKDKAPLITVENVYQEGFAFSSGEEMAAVIKKSREQFVEEAKKKGISESEAKKAADKLIGMTLDVGHLNVYKKAGFEDEHLIKEVEKFSKYVKHLHLTDNFGHSDSHLPPGMGNVPIKAYLEELEKKGFSGRTIVEAAAIPIHFNGMSPFPYILEGLGAQVYSGASGGPYWNQSIGLQQGYFGGYGAVLPQINYESFGAGFSNLPTELGGNRQSGPGSRMSGRGME